VAQAFFHVFFTFLQVFFDQGGSFGHAGGADFTMLPLILSSVLRDQKRFAGSHKGLPLTGKICIIEPIDNREARP